MTYSSKDISFLLIIFLLIILTVITAKQKKYNFFDIPTTDQMRGVAIIGIIFYHYVTKIFFPNNVYYNFIDPLGEIGVAVFLLISGFGLMMSFKKKGIEKGYLLRRLLRVLLPFWVVSIIWFFMDSFVLGIHHSIKDLVINFLGIVLNASYIQNLDAFMWFVTFILFWYIVFFFIFRTKYPTLYKIFSLFIIGAILNLLHPIFQHFGYVAIFYWGAYSLSFPIGVLIANNYDAINKYVSKIGNKNEIILYSCLLILSLAFGHNIPWILSLSIIFFVLILTKLQFYSIFLTFIGSIAYELYLIHGPLMVKYDFLLFRTPHYIYFIIYAIIITLLAFVLNKLISVGLYRRMFSK